MQEFNMKPTSYTIVSQTNANDNSVVVYTDQDGYEYQILVPLNANLDQIILGV
jgi:hypothetical protein